MPQPKLSLVTPAYNSETTIRETLASVASQSRLPDEHLIMDGGSTDSTKTIVESYQSAYPVTFVQQRDEGLYDAMNKGVTASTGEVIGIINSDDRYADEHALEAVLNAFDQEEADIVFGDLQYLNMDSSGSERIVGAFKPGPFNRRALAYGWSPPHPTFFVRRAFYERLGAFDLELPVAADFDVMLRLLTHSQARAIYVPKTLVCMAVGGNSGTIQGRLAGARDIRKALSKNKVNTFLPFYFALRYSRALIRRLKH